MQLIDAFLGELRRAAQIANRAVMRDSLVDAFKAAGIVDLKRHVEENRLGLEHSSPLGPEFFQASRDRGDPPQWDASTLFEKLASGLETAIAEWRRSGVIDRDKGEYRDRDFIVREQRVVKLNVTVDFNALVTQLGGKGIALHGIECPGCGATTAGVPQGWCFVCQHCRSTVWAVDVFEWFRGILR